ncbi:basic salivary proline-rich protein 2-like [Peromyscus eremicus]|uniref:basic salivary proline-rich protein 2-like n=1 Tax=Peromyscus eremicus TaxID=42410 RepID=UPI0027DAF521|nr:basic salivary proline-rich protein 2-like [Peromyscus eremicus]
MAAAASPAHAPQTPPPAPPPARPQALPLAPPHNAWGAESPPARPARPPPPGGVLLLDWARAPHPRPVSLDRTLLGRVSAAASSWGLQPPGSTSPPSTRRPPPPPFGSGLQSLRARPLASPSLRTPRRGHTQTHPPPRPPRPPCPGSRGAAPFPPSRASPVRWLLFGRAFCSLFPGSVPSPRLARSPFAHAP